MSFNVSLGSGGGSVRGRSGGPCGAIFGVLFGLALVPIGFYAVYYGEARLVNHGVVWARTPLVEAGAAAKSSEGLCKFAGKPSGQFLRVERYDKPVLYWDTDIEEYQEDRDSDGDIKHEWNSIGGDTKWASFSVGGVNTVADRANAIGEKTVFKGIKKRGASHFDPGVTDSSTVGDQRLELCVIDATSNLMVLGEVKQQGCSGGSTFVISALDDAGTEQALRTEYKVMYWILKGGGAFAIWMGIIAIFGPLMSLVGWIPFLGEKLTGAIAFGALAFAIFAVAVVTFAIKFFWPLLALSLVLIVFLIVKGIRSPRVRPGSAGVPGAPPPAVPPIAPIS